MINTTNRGERVAARRWPIALAGTLLQLCLGTVYAWSWFQKPLTEAYGWNNNQAAWAFSLAILFLGLSAAFGGRLLKKVGPRKLAVSGVILYAAGNALAGLALSLGSLPLLLFGYGVVGGIGLGLGYVTPVATASAWYPDKKGLVTGIVVMGFGFGALFMSKLIGPGLLALLSGGLPSVFFGFSLIVLAIGLPAALILKPAPSAASSDAIVEAGSTSASGAALPQAEAKLSPSDTREFLRVWLMFFCNIAAGMVFIGFQSPLFQDRLSLAGFGLSPESLATAGATLIAASSVCNGLGRLAWGSLSDRIGRVASFRVILASQILAFILLAIIPSPELFAVLVCWVLFCYGGGFGAMPALISERFGPERMSGLYGAVLTAWALAGVASPQLAALIRDGAKPDIMPYLTFGSAALFLVAGLAATIGLREGKRRI